MNRREFLKLGLTLAIGGFAMTTHAAEVPRRIDFHAHAILPAYVDALKNLGIDAAEIEGFPLPKWSAAEHLQFMRDAGIDFTILSMATPHIFDGKKLTSFTNDEEAEVQATDIVCRFCWKRS